MRGYAPTAVPEDGRVGPGAIVGDVNALHEALGGDDRAVLIGHDWGAVFSYAAAAAGGDRWRRVVTMAVPPSGAAAQGFMSYDQIKRSFYQFFFQSPLADFVVGANDLEFIARLWSDWSPGYDATEDMAAVRDALGKPENLQAALGYYRAILGTTPAAPEDGAALAALGQGPSQPTLYIHGRNDGCLGIEVAELGRPLLTAPNSKMEVVDDAGHFLHLEDPTTVNRLVLDHVGQS
jgi:pimeloyl-ACP methyl ester carboxylesterase